MRELRALTILKVFFLTIIYSFSQGRVLAHPLLNHETNLSLQSFGSELNTSSTKNWTDKNHCCSLSDLKIDKTKFYTKASKDIYIKRMVLVDNKNHYALTFNDKNIWNQKYNLVWGKLLKLDLFTKKVYNKGISYYMTFGLPLDNRKICANSNWVVEKTILSNHQKDLKSSIKPIHKFISGSKSTVPLTD